MCLALVVFGAGLLAQGLIGAQGEGTEGPSQKPRLALIDFTKDWGTVLQGEKTRVRYRLRNEGAEPLKIREVTPSIGALTTTFTPEISPGGNGYVDVVIDGNGLASRTGPDRRVYTARIQSNDPLNSASTINITGKLQRIISWSPRRVKLANLAGKPLAATVGLTAAEGVKVELDDVRSKFLKLDLKKPRSVASGQWEIQLKAPARKTIGFEEDSLLVEVSARVGDGEAKKLSLPIHVILQHKPRLEVTPVHGIRFSRDETARLSENPPHNHMETIKVVGLHPSVKFDIVDVDIEGVPSGMFEIDIEEVEPDKSYNVHVEILKGSEKRVRGTVRILTNDPSQGRFELHLLAQFPRKKRS